MGTADKAMLFSVLFDFQVSKTSSRAVFRRRVHRIRPGAVQFKQPVRNSRVYNKRYASETFRGRDEPVLDTIEAVDLGESFRPRALGRFGARYAFGPNLQDRTLV